MSPTAWTFQVKGQDVCVQLCPDRHTVFDLMSILCERWLDEARGGDGGIYDHLWKIDSSGQIHCGPYDDKAGLEFEDCPVSSETAEHSTPLSDLRVLALQPGQEWKVEYDFGSTTYFTICVLESKQVTEEEAKSCPRQISPRGTASTTGNTEEPYCPPEGTPTLDELFPNVRQLFFSNPTVQWILLGPLSENVAVVVEAGPNAMADMVFGANPFGSLEELLATLDVAATKMPDYGTRGDAFSRMIFPVHMNSTKEEENFQQFKREFDNFEQELVEKGVKGKIMSLNECFRAGLSEDVIGHLLATPEVIVRLSEEELTSKIAALREKNFEFDKVFPKSAASHNGKAYRWISYRRGVLQLCQGISSEERGIPQPGGVMARVEGRIRSLQELFCVAETHWPDEDSNKRKRND